MPVLPSTSRGAQSLTPRAPVAPLAPRTRRETRTPIRPSPPFLARVHPAYWTSIVVDGEAHIVLDVSTIMVAPGVGGVGQGVSASGAKVGDASTVTRDWEDKGWQVPAWGSPQGAVHLSDGTTQPYCVRYDAPSGRGAHWWAWERPVPGTEHVDVDLRAQLRWLQGLADAYGWQPAPAQIEAIRRRVTARYVAHASQPSPSGAAIRVRDRARAELIAHGWPVPTIATDLAAARDSAQAQARAELAASPATNAAADLLAELRAQLAQQQAAQRALQDRLIMLEAQVETAPLPPLVPSEPELPAAPPVADDDVDVDGEEPPPKRL